MKLRDIIAVAPAGPTAATSASSTPTSRTRTAAAGCRSGSSRPACSPTFTKPQKVRILRRVHKAELFEKFLHTKYVGQKRFSLEGGETIIAALDAVIDHCPDVGVEEIVMGMAHRGRLNVLCSVMRKSFDQLFEQFSENYIPDTVGGDGDVKYHLGYESVLTTTSGKKVEVRLAANPSHLEIVDPVVEGKARARQRIRGDTEERRQRPAAAHPRRRRARRPGDRRRDAQFLAAARLPHRRHASTSSSTTRSASRPIRATRARRATAPTWRR